MKVEIISDVQEFILNQDLKTRQSIFNSLQLLSEYGYLIRPPYSKHLGDGIYELRVNGKDIIVRLLYFYLANNKAVVTNAFIKKTRKTPKREILLALERRAMYGKTKNNIT